MTARTASATHSMTSHTQPLLTLSNVRVQDESRIAAAIARADSRYSKRLLRIILACLAEYGVGLGLLGVSWHIYGGDLAAVAFYGGMLIALCGPVWTVLLAMWLADQR